MKKLRRWLFSPGQEYSLRERMFLLAGIVGGLALLAAFFISLFTEGFQNACGTLIGFVVLVVVVSICYRTKKVVLGAAIIAIIAIFAVFPLGYVFGGGAYSGSPVWFVVIGAFLFTMLEGVILYVFFAIAVAVFGAVTYLCAAHPEWVHMLTGDYDIYVDTFLASVLITTFVGLLLRYQAMLFEKENKVVQSQVKEIKNLTESQNRFFAAMSHEIRTPINTIIGLNEMILRDNQISQEVTENALNIQNASRVLLSLINDILDMSKIESERMEITPGQYETTRMLSEIVNLLWARAKEKNLEFEVHVGDDVPSMLYGDEVRVKQVIINLVTNAIKYTKEGGVTLSISGEKQGTNDFLMRIEVADTGIGIRQENLQYIFDAFRRVDERNTKTIEGTGLGLAISQQLVALMGGQISVDSIYTKGSTFRVSLPQQIVSDVPMKFTNIVTDGAKVEQYQQIFEAPDARVLIVDDNDMNRMVTRKLLRATRVKTDLAASGQECLDKARETRYDVIFMDHEMPEMNGIETLEHLRNQTNGLCRNTPVIALTANAGADMKEFYQKNGFAAYLAKPIHGSLLEATLLQHLPEELIERVTENRESTLLHVAQRKKKKPVIITAENVCDIPDEVAEEYGIRQIPYYIVTEEGRFRDTKEIGTINVLTYLEEGKNIRTEAASVDEYELFFGEVLAEAESVIHLSCGRMLSQGFSRATQASQSFSNVHVLDTGTLSSGIGLVALRAAEMAREPEARAEDIIPKIEEISKRTQVKFLVPSLDTMRRNHAVPLGLRAMEEIFHVIPSFLVRRGRIHFHALHSNYAGGSAEKFVRSVLRGKRNINTRRLIVPHAGRSAKDIEAIREEIAKYAVFDEIIVTPASATISTNCGLYSMGLVYESRGGEPGKA